MPHDTLEGAFAAWCDDLGWSREQLAKHLGVRASALAALAAEFMPRAKSGPGWGRSTPGPPEPDSFGIGRLADRHGADLARLAEVVGAA